MPSFSVKPNKSLKDRSLRSLDSLNRRMLRACVCSLALRYVAMK